MLIPIVVVTTTSISIICTAIILLSMKHTIGLRSSDVESEIEGMDKLAHNEIAYNFESLHAILQNSGKDTSGNSSKEKDRDLESKDL